LIAGDLDAPYTVVVEPWADEFQVEPAAGCQVVALHPRLQPAFEVEIYRGLLIVYVNGSGATYEFWRGEKKEFSTPVPMP
jgi:hypothetical protein